MNLSDIKLNPLLDTLRLQKIDDSVYFSERYSEYISNSRLKLIDPNDGGSPEKYFKGFACNKIYSTSLDLGSVVHQCILQSDCYDLPPDLDKPTAKVGLAADVLYNIADDKLNPTVEEFTKAYTEVDYYKGYPSATLFRENYSKIMNYLRKRVEFEAEELDKIYSPYLDQKSLEKASACVLALKNNKKIQELLHPTNILGEEIVSENEQAILLDCEVKVPDFEPFIIRFKSKLDNYTIDTFNNVITVNDIKTHGKILPEFNNSIERYHYYRELAMYGWLLKLVSKKYYNLDNPKFAGNFLVVSTIPSYYTQVFPYTRVMLNKGWEEFLQLVRLVCYYKAQPELWNL